MDKNKKDYSTRILLMSIFLMGVLFTYIGNKIPSGRYSVSLSILGISMIILYLFATLVTSEAWRSTNKF